MIYIFVSTAAFILTLICHIIIFRMFEKIKSESNVLLTFLSGFVLNCIIIFYLNSLEFNYIKIPLTAIWLCFLLSLAFIIFFLFSFLSEESPSSTILGLLKKRGKIRERDIYSSFSEAKLIRMRLSELTHQKIIEEQNNNFIILPKGKIIANVVNFYRKILGWEIFG